MFYHNLPNLISLLGVTPLCLLYSSLAYSLLPALIIFNNFMDDMDGMLARKLKVNSPFGAALDNVCDAAAHVSITLYVGSLYGNITLIVCQIASAAILLRLTGRLMPNTTLNLGSTTNELMRHLLFLVLLERTYNIYIAPWVILVLLLHSITLVCRFPMPHLIRTQAKTNLAILLVNLILLISWLFPVTLIPIAVAFFSTYLYSFIVGGWQYLKCNYLHDAS